jgi:hypothetical protein
MIATPRDGTISAILLKMVRIDPGISTRDLVLWSGKSPSNGNVAFVGTLLNAMRRRGLIANRSKRRGASAWEAIPQVTAGGALERLPMA